MKEVPQDAGKSNKTLGVDAGDVCIGCRACDSGHGVRNKDDYSCDGQH